MSTPTTLRIAAYASDPPAMDTFHAFDPDSFMVTSLINDALIYVDRDGNVAPSLAVAWERDTPTSMVFTLRTEATFHDGRPVTADDVVATFRAHLDPDNPSMNGTRIFAPLKGCQKLGPHRVRFETKFPDALLLHRMFFSSIYPAHVLDTGGKASFRGAPGGSGPYRVAAWEHGRVIRLERVEGHWSGRATVDVLEFPIIPQSEWVSALRAGQVDVVLSLDAQDASRLASDPAITVLDRPAAMSNFFLWAHQGPLADTRVRQALNHAVHRALVVEVTEHGKGAPQAGLLTPGQLGHDPSLPAYPYDPDLCVQLLTEAGYPDGFTLRGLVSSGCLPVYLSVREFLARVGVTLEAEVVPRPEWMRRIVQQRALDHDSFRGDFALCNIDNPVMNGLFHHYIFLFSHGPFSLLHDGDYDQHFMAAATAIEPGEAARSLQALERYSHERALALFTTRQHVYAAVRPGVELALPVSGHFSTDTLLSLRSSPAAHSDKRYRHIAPASPALREVLGATHYPGVFYRPDSAPLPDAEVDRLWSNMSANQDRWQAQLKPMLRALAGQAEAKNHLSNVLSSTTRVGIIGVSPTGRVLFVNEGYADMVDPKQRHPSQLAVVGAGVADLDAICARVDAAGSWDGPVSVGDAQRALYLSASRTINEVGAFRGYTFVFSDFSGEEERIRSQAVRRILDHVPYGLFTTDADGRILAGCSRSCDTIFQVAGPAIEGTPVWDALGLEPRAAGHLKACLEQVFDDFLPEDVTLSMIPERIRSGGRSYAAQVSTIRADGGGHIESLIWSVLDVTALEAAEQEVAQMRGAMAVLADREQFEELARGYLEMLSDALSTDLSDADTQAWLRRELHTYKGALSFFELTEAVSAIHEAEEAERLKASHLRALDAGFRALLAAHVKLWRIEPDGAQEVAVSTAALSGLERALLEADSLEAARAAALAFVADQRRRPARALLGPIEETVQRLADRLGKQAALQVAGAEVPVDASLAPVFRVLPHLLRNALDHGIEPPDERGDKPEVAVISLAIERDGACTRVLLRDDGRGIDADRLAAGAVAKGLLSAEAAAALSHDEKLRLLFLDGLSTAEEVSTISGRGVGMAAVRETVEQLGGTIRIASERGRGTTFALEVPAAPQPIAALARASA